MARGVKVLLIVLGCVFGTILVVGAVGVIAGMPGQDEVRKYALPAIDMSRIPDGAYDGACDIGRFAMAVKVTVKDHRVTAVEIADKRTSNIGPDMASQLNQSVVGREKPSFDAVTGASITSKAYFIAVADALKKGMK